MICKPLLKGEMPAGIRVPLETAAPSVFEKETKHVYQTFYGLIVLLKTACFV